MAGLNDTITKLESNICEKDVQIESLENQINNFKARQNPSKAPEKHWVIESNLRDIISELKQKLLAETTKSTKLEQESAYKSEMLVKAKAEWANAEYEKGTFPFSRHFLQWFCIEKYKFDLQEKEEELEELENAYEELEKEYDEVIKTNKSK